MFEKIYSNGDKIVFSLAANGRATIRTINGHEDPLLGSVVKMPMPVTVNGTVYTHVIGGKWVLTADEYADLSVVCAAAAQNTMAFNAVTTSSYNKIMGSDF